MFPFFSVKLRCRFHFNSFEVQLDDPVEVGSQVACLNFNSFEVQLDVARVRHHFCK